MLMAMTLDGKIARGSTELVNWTGKADKHYFVRITREAGVVIMGSRTFDTIGRPLPGRKNIVMTRNRERISQTDNLIFTAQSPPEILRELQGQGFKTAALIGGEVVNTLFAREKLITQVHLTLVPMIFGQGLSLFNEPLDLNLEFMESREIDKGHLLLTYRVMGIQTQYSKSDF